MNCRISWEAAAGSNTSCSERANEHQHPSAFIRLWDTLLLHWIALHDVTKSSFYSSLTRPPRATLVCLLAIFSCVSLVLSFWWSSFPRTQSNARLLWVQKLELKTVLPKIKTTLSVAIYCKLCYLRTDCSTYEYKHAQNTTSRAAYHNTCTHHNTCTCTCMKSNNLYMYQSFNSCWFNVLHRLNKMTPIRQSVVFALLLRSILLTPVLRTPGKHQIFRKYRYSPCTNLG